MWLRLVAPLLVLACILFASSCTRDSAPILGEAYVAPATLNLRRELNQKNSTVAVLNHGERVSIIDVRRRFVKVRTDKGAEGWVDSVQLLSPEQMKQIQQNTEHYLKMPSEGSATVFEALNIHINPDRQSPSFAKIPEGGSAQVLAYRLTPKNTGPPHLPVLVQERPQPTTAKRSTKGKQAKSNQNLPARPPPPKPPANWQELSAERVDGNTTSTLTPKANQANSSGQKQPVLPAKPVIMEDWALVRTKDNHCGWVLSRNLVMSIPDEVAQYAEGKRITSYFDLGSVSDDEKGVKHNWLWTTSSSEEPYDFDSWRVFLFNRRHHRYETSYRQHDVEGYFPVYVNTEDPSAIGRSFQIITKDDDGKFRRRTYLFDGTLVHLTATEDYTPGQSSNEQKAAGVNAVQLQQKMPKASWLGKEWNAIKRHLPGTH